MSNNNQSSTNSSLPNGEGGGIVRFLSSILPDLLAIVFFIALSFAYFIKPVSEGLVLTGQDHSGGTGAASEMEAYRKAHNGERTRWTNVLFSGMPTYQIAPSYPSTERLTKVESVYKLWLPDYVVLVFVMLLGFYILLRAFDFKAWMAALGAVLWAFSSYYFIIIGAGHIWKFYTLAYIPPTIAGMVLCYRGRYGWGLIVTALFMALQILSNHVQMSYYFAFVIALMALAFFFEMKSERVKSEKYNSPEPIDGATPVKGKSYFSLFTHSFFTWLKATSVFALGCLIGIAINASNLYHTWEYSKESMRGKSELTQQTKDPQNQTSSGLERDYITAWSYGIGETWSLLIPNIKGGASVPLTQSRTAMKKADQTFMPVYQSLGQYWGEQPGTSGPVYVGAFVLFLFVLGLFIVKGPMKWALAIATLLSITLAWGKNFMPWTDFWLDYVPMYDKFRTVASILVIAEFTIPLLAMLALKEIIERVKSEGVKSEKYNSPVTPDACTANQSNSNFSLFTPSFFTLKRSALFALLLTAGPCLLFWLTPDTFFGSYVSTTESQMLNAAAQQGYLPQEMLAPILTNLNQMRSAVVSADAGRSLLIILVGCAVLVAYYFRKIKAWAMVACLIVLCTADLWDVNKRYLSDDMFSAPQAVQQSQQPTPTDEAILQDTDPYYRVVNLSVSTFNDNTTSTFHKSIGGYHAAKLRRYQELIEAYIQPELVNLHQTVAATAGRLDSVNADSLFPVLNMLNTKYAILPLQDGQTLPVQNPWAMGNAWFVDDVLLVANADEELTALGAINPRTTAVVDRRFADLLPAALVSGGGPKEQAQPAPSAEGKAQGVHLISYEANALTFEAETPEERLAVFSDIYYPGWRCTIDDKEVDLLRANYVLRAVVIPAGKHTVSFRFDPQSLHTTEALANTGLILLAVLALALIAWAIFKQRKAKNA